MDIVTKKQLNILVQLAQADKHFAKAEREMIAEIAKERNFPESELIQLIREPEPIGSLGALSSDQKINYLISCINLIFADQKVFDNEIIFSRGIAYKLGFRQGAVDFLIENRDKAPVEYLKHRLLTDYQ